MIAEDKTPLVEGSAVTSLWNKYVMASIPEAKRLISVMWGHSWSTITNHPSWVPGLSFFTGIASGCFYTAFSIAGLVAYTGGILGKYGARYAPHASITQTLKEKSLSLLSTGELLFKEDVGPATRGWVSVIPLLGNGILIVHDKYYEIEKERLFAFPTPLTHEKIQ